MCLKPATYSAALRTAACDGCLQRVSIRVSQEGGVSSTQRKISKLLAGTITLGLLAQTMAGCGAEELFHAPAAPVLSINIRTVAAATCAEPGGWVRLDDGSVWRVFQFDEWKSGDTVEVVERENTCTGPGCEKVVVRELVNTTRIQSSYAILEGLLSVETTFAGESASVIGAGRSFSLQDGSLWLTIDDARTIADWRAGDRIVVLEDDLELPGVHVILNEGRCQEIIAARLP